MNISENLLFWNGENSVNTVSFTVLFFLTHVTGRIMFFIRDLRKNIQLKINFYFKVENKSII